MDWDCSVGFLSFPSGCGGAGVASPLRVFWGPCPGSTREGFAAPGTLPLPHLLPCRKFHSWLKSHFKPWISHLQKGARQKLLSPAHPSFAWLHKLYWEFCSVVVVLRHCSCLEIELIQGLNCRAMGWSEWLIWSKKNPQMVEGKWESWD